jgi:hypothetical protein
MGVGTVAVHEHETGFVVLALPLQVVNGRTGNINSATRIRGGEGAIEPVGWTAQTAAAIAAIAVKAGFIVALSHLRGEYSNSRHLDGAVIAYAMQMVSYLVLKRRFVDMPRPYVSPLGGAGRGYFALYARKRMVRS